jgi:hypothetical protein
MLPSSQLKARRRVGGPKGGLATLGGDGVEEGGRLGVDLDRVQDVAAHALI